MLRRMERWFLRSRLNEFDFHKCVDSFATISIRRSANLELSLNWLIKACCRSQSSETFSGSPPSSGTRLTWLAFSARRLQGLDSFLNVIASSSSSSNTYSWFDLLQGGEHPMHCGSEVWMDGVVLGCSTSSSWAIYWRLKWQLDRWPTCPLDFLVDVLFILDLLLSPIEIWMGFFFSFFA